MYQSAPTGKNDTSYDHLRDIISRLPSRDLFDQAGTKITRITARRARTAC